MKICVLVHLFPVRSETFVRQHVTGLAKRGHEVTVIARGPGDAIAAAEFASLEADGVHCVYVGNLHNKLDLLGAGLITLLRAPGSAIQWLRPGVWTRRALLLATRYADAVTRFDPDVVHIHFGSLAARLHQVTQTHRTFPPTVVTWHGYEVNALPKHLGSDLYRDLFKGNSVHTVGSRFIYRRLIQLGAKDSRLTVIPMGVDLTRFTFKERTRCIKSPLRIISVGRLDEVKGHKYLVEAVAVLLQSGIPLQLRIIGDGPQLDTLRKIASGKKIEGSIQFLGALEPALVVEEMNNAHVFALTGVETSTGKVESQGVVFAEAQATGLPVIASDVGGVSESVIDRQTAILCPPTDVDAVIQALRFFANNRNAIAQYGARGRRFVEEKFSLHLMLDRFETLYQRRSSHQPET